MTATAAADWLGAMEKLARHAQLPGESYETAYARVLKTGPGKAFYAAHRDPQGRMPAAVRVVHKGEVPATAEAQLHRLAVEASTASGKSYEQNFAAILATPEGRQLWIQARAGEEITWCDE